MANETMPVLLTLRSASRNGEEETPVMNLRCKGVLRPTSSGCMLRYQEVQKDEDTGNVLSQDVILALQPDRVTMTRLGDYGTTMLFIKDRRFEGAYHTPYGDLELALFATQVNVQMTPEGGSVHLEYQLDMQGSYAAVQVIDVEYVVVNEGAC